MISAVFRKEYYKIRRLWLGVLLMNLALCVRFLICTRRLFILDHPEVVWYRVLHLGQIHYEIFRYVPAATGILIACIQYLPEMWGERLKLSLHLPISSHLLILVHVWVGLTALFLALLPDLGIMVWVTQSYFPIQALFTTLSTAFPWFLAGVAAYLGATLVLLEPHHKRKLFNLALGVGCLILFLVPTEPGSYARLSIPLILPLVCMAVSVLLPAFRFRYRRLQ